MPKFVGKDYSELSESTKKRLEGTLDRAYKSGYTINELLQMNDSEFREKYGTKAKDLSSQRRLLNQVKGTTERKRETINRIEVKFQKEGYKPKRLDKVMRDVKKVAGNTFDAVYSQILEHYTFDNKEAGYQYARELLKIPSENYDDLNEVDKEIIEGYDTSP